MRAGLLLGTGHGKKVFSNRWMEVCGSFRGGIKAHPCAVIPKTHVRVRFTLGVWCPSVRKCTSSYVWFPKAARPAHRSSATTKQESYYISWKCNLNDVGNKPDGYGKA